MFSIGQFYDGHQELRERNADSREGQVRSRSVSIQTVSISLLIMLKALLDRLKPVKTAFHDHTEAATACLEGTRVDLLDSITEWLYDEQGESVYWLSGAAGTGKTTVAQSVANIAQELDFISASFFFSRASDERRSYGEVIPTLAYQLGKSKRLRHGICAAVESDDDINVRSVRIQAEKLLQDVLTPMPSELPPCVLIVIDALDESKEDAKQVHGGELIPVLLALLKDVPFVRLFLTSRQESSIERLFSRRTASKATRALVLHRDIAKDKVQADIERYLRDELAQLEEDVANDVEFPTNYQIRTLVERANGLFIYARTALEYISSPDGQPERRIVALIQTKPGLSSSHQYGRLDQLYLHILREAHISNKNAIDALRATLITLVLLQQELPAEAFASVAGVDDDICRTYLRRLSAVLNYQHGSSEPVRMMHASFADFMLNPQRCSDMPSYVVDLPGGHLYLTECCLAVLIKELRFNICDIRDPSLFNNEVLDLQARLDQSVSAALRYACRYWAVHWLEHIRAADSPCCIPSGLEDFSSVHILHWIEVLSLTGAFDPVRRVMPDLLLVMKVSTGPLLQRYPSL
jgi:hypothetical protein